MSEPLPPGQQPVDPRGAFQPPPPPPGAPRGMWPPPGPPPGWRPPTGGGGFARGIFLTLATTIFGLSLALNVYLLVFSGVFFSDRTTQNVIQKGDPKNRIAVIPLEGILLADAAEQFDGYMDRAGQDATVRAVVIAIDTPGGDITSSDRIHHRIRQFRREKPGVPVVVSMQSLATSGGYYAACAAEHIVAQRTTLTGNIGVLFQRFNMAGLAEKWGIEDSTLASSGADFKDAGSFLRPETAEERAYFQDLIDQAFGTFKSVVVEGRSQRLKGSIDAIANGKVYTAVDAERLGLIDSIGYLEDAVAHAATAAGLSDPAVVRYSAPPTLFDVLGMQSRAPTGLRIELDGRAVEGLLTPRLMYLWRP